MAVPRCRAAVPADAAVLPGVRPGVRARVRPLPSAPNPLDRVSAQTTTLC